MIPRDKQTIRSPNTWANWPFLPMKNRRIGYETHKPTCALIVGDPNLKDNKVWFVPGGNLFHIDDEKIKKDGSWRDIDEILEEGWMVD